MSSFQRGRKHPWQQDKPLTPEIKKKISDKRKLSNPGFEKLAREKTSCLERIVAAELDLRKIVYEQQFKVNRFFCDFFLPNSHLILECDGDYWHRRRAGAIERGLIRDEIITAHGFKIYHLAELLILDSVQLKQELDNLLGEGI